MGLWRSNMRQPEKKPATRPRRQRIGDIRMPCWRCQRHSPLPRPATKRANIRDDVGFFQTIRAALGKEQQFRPRQVSRTAISPSSRLIDRAVVSTEIVDILARRRHHDT